MPSREPDSSGFQKGIGKQQNQGVRYGKTKIKAGNDEPGKVPKGWEFVRRQYL